MSDYKSSGVDTSAADAWTEHIARLTGSASNQHLQKRLRSGIGDYAAVFEPEGGGPWIATSCDGVGTKLLWTLQGLGSPADLAQDLLAMNANDLLCVGARPTLFLDYLAVGSKSLLKEGGVLADFMQGLVHACTQTGQLVVGGETAQMPELYADGKFDLAGFSVGFLSEQDHLHVDLLKPGQEVWGWESSGPQSNGFSLLRKLFDSQKDAAFIRDHLMVPTSLYVNPFLNLRDKLKDSGLANALKGAFHITGSGWLNFVRAQPRQTKRTIGIEIDPNLNFPKHPWLQAVRERSGLSEPELFSTFNMGFGFAVVLEGVLEVGQSSESLLQSIGLRRLGRVIDEPVVKFPSFTLR